MKSGILTLPKPLDNDTKELHLRLGSSRIEDVILWHYEEIGRYTVNNGYWVGRNMEAKASTSSGSSQSFWWKVLWKLKIPQKVKIFVWKTCFDWIPTTFSLAQRDVPVMVRCPACRASDDSTFHAL
ncbi:hypothetical protein Dsin_025592 [Dipteronia sinensis]|uniref:Reverse transcriptase zinc-binding domain-containing protein n=1 Tax=Dipteronia sinensis TaxID=43782 RepID=A0AAE0DX40_9ROSI|nr:hypothetical protein Dsin_025592 [Dipteronia sinensis]